MSLTKADSPTGIGAESEPEYFYHASSPVVHREIDEWDLERAMNEYADTYGNEALAEKVGRIMTERGAY